MITNHLIQEVDTIEFTATKRSDGIIHVFIKPHTTVNRVVQIKLQEAYLELADKPMPFVFEGGEFVSVTKEARVMASENEEHLPIKVSAFVVRNLAQKILADYYYRINKPKKPLKVFKEMDDALQWINTFHY